MTALMIARIAAGAVISGASLAAAGFVLSNLRLTFLGVTMSHAAMAGAVFARLAGFEAFPGALAAAFVAALLIGPLADLAEIDVNLAMGIMFSFMMGLTFLGIGMAESGRSELLGLIWGSVLFMTSRDLALIALSGGLLLVLIAVLEKEVKAALFSRALAAASGIRESIITYSLIAVIGAVITASLETVGGLMLFALLTNPAAAAGRVFTSFRAVLIGAAALGALSALAGIAMSAALNLPAGASIVLASGLVFVVCLAVSAYRARRSQSREENHE